MLGLHRMRRQLIDMRRMQSNQLKGLLYEFGVVAPAKITAAQLAEWVAAGRVPQLLAASLGEQIERIGRLKREELRSRARSRATTRTMIWRCGCSRCRGSGRWGRARSRRSSPRAASYASGRRYAACKGIAPRLSGTGGKVRPGAISKRGDPYVRTLLIHGARSVIAHRRRARRLSPWLGGLLERRPFNVAVVAVANKMARTAWALAAHERTYQENYGAQAA